MVKDGTSRDEGSFRNSIGGRRHFAFSEHFGDRVKDCAPSTDRPCAPCVAWCCVFHAKS